MITLEDLQKYFKEQTDLSISNLFFLTKETHPSEDDEWRMRAFPVAELADLLPYLEGYEYYRTTNKWPRFFKS